MSNKIIWLSFSPFVFLVSLEIIMILYLNNGIFTYTLDDAYIHLSLAQNIFNGNYGINYNEFSAPSSSIIWPFLLAPFSTFKYFYLMPLILNIFLALIILYLLINFLRQTLNFYTDIRNVLWMNFLVFIILITTNLVGLVFVGMEHTLQILLIVLIALGLINLTETRMIPKYLSASIILAPLIRYENMAISLSAIILLFILGKRKAAIFNLVILFLLVGLFSLFLYINTGSLLPTSVLLKSSEFNESSLFFPIKNFFKSLKVNEGLRLAFSLFILISLIFYTNNNLDRKKLAGTGILAITLHLFFGQYGWFQRYELYIWSFVLLILLFLFKDKLRIVLELPRFKNASFLLLGSILFFHHYYYAIFATPFASNNIYEQHYLMHKFIKDFYKDNVGVHDIGYVSFNNPYYVLDVNGLSNHMVYKARKDGLNSKYWLNKLASEKNVQLFIIYDSIIELPDNWIKVGSLCLSRKNVIAFGRCVSFYITNTEKLDGTISKINDFKKYLPTNVKLELNY